MKHLTFALLFILTGCNGFHSAPITLAHEIYKANTLEGKARCDRIHVDFRKECREELAKEQKETEELSKAMKKK